MSQEANDNRSIRVLHILQFYRPDFTGEGVFLERSSAVMQELAPDVEHELLVTHTPAPADPALGAVCSTLRRVTYLNSSGFSALRLWWWMLWNLPRFSTVHVRTHADRHFGSYLLAKLFGKRLVLSATLDDSLPVLIGSYRPSKQAIARRAFAVFDAYVGISPKLDAETRTIAPSDRCHIIPCGITAPKQPTAAREAIRTRIGADESDPILLFVGGLVPRKDPMTLIEALPRLRAHHPRTRLVLVGPEIEPPYAAALRRAATLLEVANAVHFVGEQRDPHPWFAAADILVFASRLEGFGTVVPEAMAHGLPVVARRLPGVNDDFVLDGQTGFLFDDKEGLVAGVLRLLGDVELRRQIGSEARDLARRKFAMGSVARKWLKVYGLEKHILSGPIAELPETELGYGSSIPDKRFHTFLKAPATQPPILLTMVNAVESFDWSRPSSREATDVRAMAQQYRAHVVFDRHGVTPTYLVSFPIASQADGYLPLHELLHDGRADVGAQLHPWVNPPFLEEVGRFNCYGVKLPAALEYEKVRRLTETIEETFGLRPLIFRAGRFGAGRRTADVLRRLGYLADSSMAVCWPPDGHEWQRDGSSVSSRPYWLDREQTLMEIPASAGLVGPLAGRLGERIAPFALTGPKHRPLAGALAKLGLLERIQLSPECSTLPEAKRLVRHMIGGGHDVFVVTYHCPSLEPGNTPYTRTARDVEYLLGWLDAFYAFFTDDVGGRMGTWRDVRFASAAAAAPGTDQSSA